MQTPGYSEVASADEKLIDPTLKRFAREAKGGASVSVIVEVGTLLGHRSPRRQPGSSLPRRTFKASRETAGDPSSHWSGFDRLLRCLGSQPVVELPNARSVVVSVTPQLLRKLVTLPEVTAVRLNRSHRVATGPR